MQSATLEEFETVEYNQDFLSHSHNMKGKGKLDKKARKDVKQYRQLRKNKKLGF